MISGSLRMGMNLSALSKLQKSSGSLFAIAMERGAIQFLNWANNGSAKESRKPPIRWGVLRGSSSAFVGSKLVDIFSQDLSPDATEAPTPAKEYSGKGLNITWVWNTDYAAKMHEWKGAWGKFTEQDGDAGNKWLERHLKRDKNDLMKMIAKEIGREAGM